MKYLRLLLSSLAMFSLAAVLRAEPVKPTPAPAWKLKDVDGNVVSSEQFKGKVIVVDFWATWCGPCRTEIPGYVALQKKYRDAGLVVVGVSLDQQGPGVVKKFITTQKVDYQIVMGTDEVVEAFGGMDAIPTTFIIDRDGNIRDRKVGAEPEEEFEARLKQFLKS